ALISVGELHRLLRLIAWHDEVGKTVDADAARRLEAAEVRMQAPGAAVVDERDELRRARVDRSAAQILIPPVVGGKERTRQRSDAFGTRRLGVHPSVRRDQAPGEQSEHRQLASHGRDRPQDRCPRMANAKPAKPAKLQVLLRALRSSVEDPPASPTELPAALQTC